MPEAGRGDGDPLDICVVSERPITKTEVLVEARIVGGLPMLDGGEADDEIAYDRAHAEEVVRAAMADCDEMYGRG